MHFKMSSGKWRQFCLGLNVLISINVNMNMNNDIRTGVANCLCAYGIVVFYVYFTSNENNHHNNSNNTLIFLDYDT